MPTLLALVLAAALVTQSAAWPSNLLTNPDAAAGTAGWTHAGAAGVEGAGADAHFAVRYPDRFQQIVALPPDAAGRYLALIARASSGRVNARRVITGYPSLYGMILAADQSRILAHLQQPPTTIFQPTRAGAWGSVYGVFLVPAGAAWLVVSLQQAQASGVPQDGSAARFDDVGAYLLPTRDHASSFVAAVLGDTRQWPSGLVTPAVAQGDVVAFDPARGTILSESEGLRGVRQCSRRTPGPVQGLWTPDAAIIATLEPVLASALHGALERASPSKPPPVLPAGAAAPARFTAVEYYRQYSGLIIGGRRVVYVNGFRSGRTPPANWQTVAPRTCDGGLSFFGAEFDVETGTITDLSFNGGRGR